MPDLTTRFVTAAARDPALRKMLLELAELDARAMGQASGPSGDALSPQFTHLAERVSSLCDQVAKRIATPDDDADEIGQWISYNCQDVARAL